MKTLQLSALAVLYCVVLTTSSFGQRAAESGTITLKDNKGHEVTLIPQRTAPEGSWVFEIPYDSPYLHTGDQKPQANPLGDEPYITFGAGDGNLSNNRILAVSSGLSLTLGGTDNSNATLANTGVLSLAGTTNQVNVSASTGAITLSLPQNIHTGATPAFVNASLTGMSAGSTFTNIVVSNGGALETRTIASLGKADGSEPLLTFNAGGSSMTNNRVLSPGFGIALTDAGSDNGAFTIENSGVLSAIGTANQVNVSAATGNVTFSLPQNIHTGASPTFQGLSIGGFTGTSIATDLVVSLGGVLETRSIASLGKSDGIEPYLTFAPGGSSMTNNRVLTAGTGIILTDAGSDNGAMTVSLPGIPWTLNGNNFNPGDFIGGEAGNTNPLDMRTNNTTRLLLNEDASIQRDAGGNPRGLYSTDMQATRSSNDQVASGFFATISGGADNRANGTYAPVIGGGIGNISSAVFYSTVGGGNNNNASGNYSSIGGGRANVASGPGATIGGGGHDGTSARGNVASGIGTTIGGGAGNDATVDFSTVGGGVDNIAANYAATVGGGDGNQAYNYGTVVGGGAGNQVYEFLGTVSGGGGNATVEEMGTISGGLSNIAWGVATTISGGVSNTANADSSTIGGGSFNTTSGLNSTVNGGSSNRALSQYSTVGGGHNNLASGGTRATVGGGGSNLANANYATVGGGLSNTASHNSSTVGGGQSNSAANDGSTVSGGLTNTADGSQSAIAGGANNRTSGGSSAIGGGSFNTASGAFSAIPGGTQNTASGERSTAMGNYANATNYGQVSHASGRFAASGDAQGSLYTLRNTTSGATSSDLYLDGTSLALPIANNSAVTFNILVVGKSSAGETAGYELKGIIERVGGTTAIIGAVVKTVLGEDDAAWDVAATAGVSSLTITATGNTSDDVRWVATVRTSEVTY